MSCNPRSLRDDLGRLTGPEGSYRLIGARAFDTLPQTAHRREPDRWYAEEASVTVAARFLAELHRLRQILSQQPLRSPEIEPGTWRLLFQDRFPYALIHIIRRQR